MEAKRNTKVGAGVSSMLMIFVVLCLTTFAVLSFVTANADRRLTLKTEATASEYYEADAQAEEVLAQLDGELLKLREQAAALPSEQAAAVYKQSLLALVLPGSDLVVKEEGQTITALFTVPAGEGRSLEVRALLAGDPYADGQRYTVTAHKLVDTRTHEEPEEEVWQGD
jgi:hypothetical protein